MKKILLTFIFLISLTACELKKNKPIEKTVANSKEIISDFDTQKNELTELKKNIKLREEINELYKIENEKCGRNTSTVTNFNEKTEYWRICETENGKRIIRIESHEKESLYEEVYFEQNGELIYAEESIKYIPINHYASGIWNCQFYAKKGELISLMSLGHGKTEDDKWNPEIIFEMYKKRLTELKQIKK